MKARLRPVCQQCLASELGQTTTRDAVTAPTANLEISFRTAEHVGRPLVIGHESHKYSALIFEVVALGVSSSGLWL